jgi:ankyrin repeat protein
MTPAHAAAHNGKGECLSLLLEKGAQIDPRDKYGDSPLHKSVSNGHSECTR